MIDFDAFGADRDEETVTAAGEPVHATIDGVLTRRPTTHVDHRGRLFEIVNNDPEFWAQPIVHSYCFTIRANTLKGWGVHQHKTDRYCLISGETLTLLYDGRRESPTYQLVQKVPLTPQGIRMLTIPTGVWHLSINVAPVETMLVNFPTLPYRYEAPDRLTLPWNSPDIPVDVADYFPRQYQSGPGAGD